MCAIVFWPLITTDFSLLLFEFWSYLAGLGSQCRSEPGVFGSLEPEPEPLEKKPRAGAGAAMKKSQGPEPELEPLKNSRLLSIKKA